MERKMSRDLIHRAIVDCEDFRTPRLKLLLLTLLRFGDHDGRQIYPGKALLARKLGCTEQWIKMLLRELEQDGFIVALDKKGGRGHKSEYRINLVKLGLEITAPAIEVSETPPDTPAIAPTNGHKHTTVSVLDELERLIRENPRNETYPRLREQEIARLQKEEKNVPTYQPSGMAT